MRQPCRRASAWDVAAGPHSQRARACSRRAPASGHMNAHTVVEHRPFSSQDGAIAYQRGPTVSAGGPHASTLGLIQVVGSCHGGCGVCAERRVRSLLPSTRTLRNARRAPQRHSTRTVAADVGAPCKTGGVVSGASGAGRRMRGVLPPLEAHASRSDIMKGAVQQMGSRDRHMPGVPMHTGAGPAHSTRVRRSGVSHAASPPPRRGPAVIWVADVVGRRRGRSSPRASSARDPARVPDSFRPVLWQQNVLRARRGAARCACGNNRMTVLTVHPVSSMYTVPCNLPPFFLQYGPCAVLSMPCFKHAVNACASAYTDSLNSVHRHRRTRVPGCNDQRRCWVSTGIQLKLDLY